MTSAFVVGLDVGSTWVKGLLVDGDGATVASARRATPWTAVPDGRTELAPQALDAAVTEILGELATAATAEAVDARVTAIGVSGMAESGVLLRPERHLGRDGSSSQVWLDNVVSPIVAWFDPRGREALDALPTGFAREFRRRTGLPCDPLATFAKLLVARAEGLDLAGLTWLNVPEAVAHALGGDRCAETSLVARTGLLDQDTAQVWPDAVEVLGADAHLLPPVRTAGSVWGHGAAHLPAPLRGAVLTVAGHDHVVASMAAGALDPDQLYLSMGTAEALVRVLDTPLDGDARDRLARRGVDVVRHVLPGRSVMLAGTRSGLLMRRVLQLVGVHDAAGRAALDDAVMALDGPVPDLRVRGAANDEGVLRIEAGSDGLSPAALFAATLEHGSEVLRDVLAVMDAEVEPARRTVVAGGWADMRSVRRARSRDLPDITYADQGEQTAHGACLVAAFAADPTSDDLVQHVVGHLTSHTPTPQGAP